MTWILSASWPFRQGTMLWGKFVIKRQANHLRFQRASLHGVEIGMQWIGLHQCDQIGWFRIVFGKKLCYKSSPNVLWMFGLFSNKSLLEKTCFGYFIGNFWKQFGYISFPHLVTVAFIHKLLSSDLSCWNILSHCKHKVICFHRLLEQETSLKYQLPPLINFYFRSRALVLAHLVEHLLIYYK